MNWRWPRRRTPGRERPGTPTPPASRATRLVRTAPVARGGVQDRFLGIARVADGVVHFAGGERCALVAVEPVDLAALDPVGQERLALAYRALLNGLDDPIQIVARHIRHGLEEHRERHDGWVAASAAAHPRLARLGAGQAAFLRELARRRLLVRQQFLVAVADPAGQRAVAGLAERAWGNRHGQGREEATPPIEREAERAGRLAEGCAQVIEGLRAAGLVAYRLDDPAIVDTLRAFCDPGLAALGPVDRAALAAVGPDGAADLIAPGSVEVGRDTLRIDGGWARGIVVGALPRPVAFGWLRRLVELVEEFDVAYHVAPRDRDRTLREIRRRLGQYGSSEIADANLGKAPDGERRLAREDNERLEDGIRRGVETPFALTITVLVRARRREELEERTARVLRLLKGLQLEPRVAWLEQDRAFATVLPGGRDLLRRTHDADTTSLALSFPFIGRGVTMPGGILYGLGAHDAILVDLFDRDPHTGLKNANLVVAGVAGSGKSQAVKALCARSLVCGHAWIILDPERDEYRPLCAAAGGRWTSLGAGDGAALNPFDLPPAAADGEDDRPRRPDPVGEAVAGLVELIELMAAEPGGRLDRPCRATLEEALFATYAAAGIIRREPTTWARTPPLLADLDRLLAEREAAARRASDAEAREERSRLATLRAGLAPFVHGAQAALCDRQTAVALDAHLVVFNIHAIPAALRPVAAQLVGDFVWKQIRRDPTRHRLVYLDEGWTFLGNPAGAAFLERAARQFRKYGSGLIVATQELADFLDHPAGRVVLGQAETKLLLAQSAATIGPVVAALGLTPPQRQFLLGAAPGQALLCVGTRILPIEIVTSDDERAIGETRPDRRPEADAYLHRRFGDLLSTMHHDGERATTSHLRAATTVLGATEPTPVAANGQHHTNGRWDWGARR